MSHEPHGAAAHPWPPAPLEEPVLLELATARDLARLTRHARIGAGHLALAFLSRADGGLDALLAERFSGLRPASVTESLLNVLEIEAELAGSAAGAFPDEGLPPPEQWAEDALYLLARAGELAAAAEGGRIGWEHLARALFEQPPAPLADAFRDAGVSVPEIQALAPRLAAAGPAGTPASGGGAAEETGGEAPAAGAAAPEVFAGGRLRLQAFGATAAGALALLARRAAAEPGRLLGDADLLACLLEAEGSRLAEALYVQGLPVPTLRRRLAGLAAPPAAAGAVPELAEERLTRLLRRVLAAAAERSAEEGAEVVSESCLVRTHLDRVAAGSGNLYQRLGVDTGRLREYLRRYPADHAEEPPPPGRQEVEDLAGFLRSRVIRQEAAIEAVLPALKRLRTGLAEPGRLAGVFLFLGPTGVGKTELARAIAEAAFGAGPGREAPLIKLDCGNFTERRDIVQLLGAPQGLVGYKEGQLTNGLAAKPRAVILFDEAEKADPHIWQSLLPLFDDGVVREADGTEHDATGCIVIATSNLGYAEAIREHRLWERELDPAGGLPEEVVSAVWQRVEEYFSPEFRGRFGRENVLFFNHFDLPAYRAIVALEVDRLQREMAGRGFELAVPPEVADLLADLAWEDREEGARPVRRLLTRHLRNPLVDALVADPGRRRFAFVALQGRREVALAP